MALQGTLDTFALPDLLRLLSTTKKTGRLRLTGPRGTGSISVDGGAIGVIEVSAAPLAVEPADALFELLRFEQGSFTFDADSEPVPTGGPGVADLESLLAEAESLLAEWREIELVVPSMDAWVTLRPSLAAPTVSLDRDLWAAIATIGGGATMRHIADALALPELPASRAMRALVELGLADVAPEVPYGEAATGPSHRVEPVVAAAEPASFVTAFPGLDGVHGASGAHALVPAPRSAARNDERVHDPAGSQGPDIADDAVVDQLARLSPRAAEAVRNAAAGSGDPNGPLAAGEPAEENEPINRGLLLKFLSSVKD